MNPDKQRIAIAEACGWFLMDGNWYMPNGAKSTADGGRNEPPVFLNDLNAMHEAEKMLKGLQQVEYSAALASLYATDRHCLWWRLIHATAAQRAEAFLRTLSLWEDSL